MSFDLDKLVEDWTPPETFEVNLRGVKVMFRSCQGFGAYRQLERDAASYAASFQGYRDSKTADKIPWKNWRYLPVEHSEVVAAFIVQSLMMQQITDEEALYLCRAPLLMEELMASIKAFHYGRLFTGLNESIEAEKKSSPKTKD